jgi:formylglycine-generating enzyme required for sulfatase activity
VGQYGENVFGLFDMHGNTAELCQDVYDSKAYESRSGITQNPLSTTSSESKEYRVLRGGSWYGIGGLVRSAFRDKYEPYFGCDSTGFRVVLSVGTRTRNP